MFNKTYHRTLMRGTTEPQTWARGGSLAAPHAIAFCRLPLDNLRELYELEKPLISSKTHLITNPEIVLLGVQAFPMTK